MAETSAQVAGRRAGQCNPDQVLRAVIDYLAMPNTDHALLITGPWGSGKTHFWKHVLRPRILEMRIGGVRGRPLYASMYGCRDIRDLDAQLFLSAHPAFKERWAKPIATGGRVIGRILRAFTGFEMPPVDLRWLISTKSAVLCFDDLERTILAMEEALGYINAFVEHNRAKVIILCNEQEIRAEGEDAYHKMKEKVVGASCELRPNPDTVCRSIIDEYSGRHKFHGCAGKTFDLFRCLFERSGTHNIRSLRRALSVLAILYERLESAGISPHCIARQLIYAVAPTAFDLHGRGAKPDELRSIHKLEHMAHAGISASFGASDAKVEQSYEKAFADRYFPQLDFGELGEALGCPPICEFILTGVLDGPALIAWAQKLTAPPDERKQRIGRLTLDPDDMSDAEFATDVASVLAEIDGGEIGELAAYRALYRAFHWFCTEGLIGSTHEVLLKQFCDGLRKAMSSGTLRANPRFSSDMDHPGFKPETKEESILIQRLIEANDVLLEGLVRDRVQRFASCLKAEPQQNIGALAAPGADGFGDTAVFHLVPEALNAEWIIGLPNALKRQLRRILHSRYQQYPSPRDFAPELPALIAIRNDVTSYCDKVTKAGEAARMSVVQLRYIAADLKRAIERIQGASGPAGAT